MPGLEETLDLRIDDALSSVDRLEAAIADAADRAGASLEAALASSITAAFDTVTPPDLEATVTTTLDDTSVSDLEASIAEPRELTVATAVDDTELARTTDEIDASDGRTIDIVAHVDDSELEDTAAKIEGLDGSAVSLNVDTNAGAASAGLDAAASSAHNLSAEGLGVGAAFTSGIGLAQGNVRGLASGLGGVAAPLLAVGAGVTALFEAGERLRSSQERLNLVFGDTAAQVDKIDVGGLDETIGSLALKVGSSGAALRQSVATMGQFAINAGASREAAGLFGDRVAALAARAVALNPALGDAGDVALRMSRGLAVGGRFAQQYGLNLAAGDIAQRAMTDSGKTNAAQLTVTEKAMAGAELATERLGKRLGTDIERGSEQSVLALRRVQRELGAGLAKAGAPLVDTIIEGLQAVAPIAVEVAGDVGQMGEVFAKAFGLAVQVLKPLEFVLGHIPGPLLQAVAGFVAFRSAISLGTAIASRFVAAAQATTRWLTFQKTATVEAAASADALAGAEVSAASSTDALTVAQVSAARAALTTAAADDTAAAAAELHAATQATLAGALGSTGSQSELAAAHLAVLTGNVDAANLALESLGLAAITDDVELAALGGELQIAGLRAAILAGDLDVANIALAGMGVATVATEAELAALGVEMGVIEAEAVGMGAKLSASLGTIGIVVGVAVGVASALGLFSNKAGEAAAAARDLRDAMDSAGEALLDTGKAATVAAGATAQLKFDTEKAKEFQGLIDLFPVSFNKAGVSALELARTVEHGGPAFDTMKTAILDAARAAGVQEGKLRALENGLDAARASAQAAAETTAENARTQIDNNNALEVGQIAALKAAGHYDLLSEAHRRNGDRLLAEHDALEKNTRALGDHMSAQDRARANARRAERQADQLARAVEREADAYNDAKDALDRYLGKPLDAAHQQLELEQSISDTRDAFKENAGAIDASTGAINTHTVAGQRLTDQLLSDAETIGTTIKALADTGDIEGANKALADYRQRLINAAGGGEIATKAIDRFLASVNLVPKKVTTQYENSGLGKAARELDNYNKAIDVFPTEKQTIWRNIEDPAARAQAISDYIQSLPREKWVEYRTKLNERELDIVNGRIVKLTAARKAEIRLETDPASRVQAQKELDYFTRPRTIDVYTNIHTAAPSGGASGTGGLGGRARGGRLTEGDTLVGEEGPELARKRGATVDIYSHADTARMLSMPPTAPMLVQSRDSEGVSRDRAIVRALDRLHDKFDELLAVNKKPPQPRRGQQRQAPVVAGDIVVRDRKEAVDVLADLADRLH